MSSARYGRRLLKGFFSRITYYGMTPPTNGLNLSKMKTRIVHITEGFDFLSQTVRKVVPDTNRFTAVWREESGKRYTLFLFRMSDLPIRRHVRIKGNANPYSPSWQNYSTRRVAMKAGNVQNC